MEIMEYKHHATENKNSGRSIAGYTLGLIGSTLSLVVCFVTAFSIFSISGLINKGLDLVVRVPDVQRNQSLLELIEKSGDIINGFVGAVSVYWIIIFVGFIFGIVGTILCWKRNSVLSASIMIIGGVFSIACVLFPGIFLLIGGIINLRNVNRKYDE